MNTCTKQQIHEPFETDPVGAQACWDNFISHLQNNYPIGSDKKKPLVYKNLMGSIERFERIFMEANAGKSSQP